MSRKGKTTIESVCESYTGRYQRIILCETPIHHILIHGKKYQKGGQKCKMSKCRLNRKVQVENGSTSTTTNNS